MAKLSMLCGFTKGNCGCFILINKWRSWVQSPLCAIWLYVQIGSDNSKTSTNALHSKLSLRIWFTIPESVTDNDRWRHISAQWMVS